MQEAFSCHTLRQKSGIGDSFFRLQHHTVEVIWNDSRILVLLNVGLLSAVPQGVRVVLLHCIVELHLEKYRVFSPLGTVAHKVCLWDRVF